MYWRREEGRGVLEKELDAATEKQYIAHRGASLPGLELVEVDGRQGH